MDDRVAITDLINEHGHLVDRGDFAGLAAVFTTDVVCDVTDFGLGVLVGLDASRESALELGDRNPVAHHVTNIVLREAGNGVVHARSKGFGVTADGRTGSVTYEDRVEHTPAGWRIAHRVIRLRRVPLRE
ncbi:nuclear transport factor 2 family protein [Dactylosporangium sp. NPDC051541]|uniref:nuclear transport factor 2 family protein n=1 Tax=Dactylosporangium sp. NPDC051541 TaxID=3363977 RepID=UPI0037BCC0F1